MSDLTFVTLTLALGCAIGRLVFLELQIKSLKKNNLKIYKNAHQLLNSFFDDLQKPLSSLLGIRSLYIVDKIQDERVSEYSDIVEHCANHSNFEIDKARLFFELCSDVYKTQSGTANLLETLENATTVVSNSNPSLYIRYNFDRINSDIQLHGVDQRLYKALFYLVMNQLAENTPHTIECTITQLYNNQLQIDFTGHEIKGKYHSKGFLSLDDLADQLMTDNDRTMSIDDKLSGALQSTLSIKSENQIIRRKDVSQRIRITLPKSIHMSEESHKNDRPSAAKSPKIAS